MTIEEEILEQGWIEVTEPDHLSVIEGTKEWTLYRVFTVVGEVYCRAKSDDAARECADMLEDLHAQDAKLQRVYPVARMIQEPDYKIIGFTINRVGLDGRKLNWDEYEPKLVEINTVLRALNLPDVMDEWKTWHEGAIYRGSSETVEAIEAAMATVPDIGMQVYSQFPEEFYKAKQINAEKYL